MAKIVFTPAELKCIAAIRAALDTDDGTEYGWIHDLPEDPGIPTPGDDVVAEVLPRRK
jgi:hypothetical protein